MSLASNIEDERDENAETSLDTPVISHALAKHPTMRGNILSPLRYPGSKRRLAGYIRQIITSNHLHPGLFVEPFAGGASVALQMLNDDVVDTIGLIDQDPLVASFWRTVFFDASWLIQQVEQIEITLEKWTELKNTMFKSRRGRAIACLFLNRTSFSGILAPGAGPLGGWKQESSYKLDCRFGRTTLIERIGTLSLYKKRVAFVWNTDWQKGLARIAEKQQAGQITQDAFYYFDPPFFDKAEDLYSHYFKWRNHKKLRDKLVAFQDPYILSYDNPEKVAQLYGSQHNATNVQLLYGMYRGTRRVANEVLISNLPLLSEDVKLHGPVRASKSPYIQEVLL